MTILFHTFSVNYCHAKKKKKKKKKMRERERERERESQLVSTYILRDWIQIVDFPPFCTRETTFLTSRLFSEVPLLKTVPRKEIVPTGSKFFHFRIKIFSRDKNSFERVASPSKCISFP